MKSLKSASYILFLILLGACTPDPIRDLTAEDSQVFITNFEPTANFGSFRTFSLPDSVFTLQNQRQGISNSSLDGQVIGRVATNLSRRGYQRVQRELRPDLGVNIIRVSESQTNVVANPNPWLWNSYWGFMDPWAFGPGAGFFFPPTFSFFETTETYWQIDIVDFRNVSPTQRPTVVWNAQIRGQGIFEASRLTGIIDAVFEQSPYLQRR
ncbi:MAG: DUF4136 domain-containing protein [Runella sp.]